MPVRKAFLLSLFALLTACAPSARAQLDAAGLDDALIKGTTDFLAERARENALYIFELKLKDDRVVECYLPTIYSDLRVADLRLLLVARQSFWRTALDQDMKASAKKLVVGALHSHHAALSRLIAFLKFLNQEADKGAVILPPQPGADLNAVIVALQAVESGLENIAVDDRCGLPAVLQESTWKSGTDGLRTFQTWLKNNVLVGLDLDKLEIDGPQSVCGAGIGFSASTCNFIRNAKAAKKAKSPIAVDTLLDGTIARTLSSLASASISESLSEWLDPSAQPAKKPQALTRIVLDVGQLIEQYPSGNAPDAQKATRYLLFFAGLAEARSADQVKNILTAYTLPPVSFGEKRRATNHVLITAYVGWGQGHVRNSSVVGDRNRGGIYAPIGLEFSSGFRSGSLSLLLAPVDFGYPLSLKFNNAEKSATLADVMSPSVAVSYGVPEYPVSVGVAYQAGRKADLVNERERRTLFFIAFDMPLMVLH